MSRPFTPPIVRFRTMYVEDESGCWLWIGSLNAGGYGQFNNGQTIVKAYRWSYEHHVGPVPEGLDLDHLCRVRHCVNPAHLEPVTRLENILRGVGPAGSKARFAAQTHCRRGHEYTEENTYVKKQKGGKYPNRICRTCQRDRKAASR